MAEGGKIAFYDDGACMSRSVQSDTNIKFEELPVEQFYQIQKTIDIILQKDYKIVALQFPDCFLEDSGQVVSLLEARTKAKFFILADTSYGSENVDEVAAEHVGADFIVHYGRAILSPGGRLPVLYVLGRGAINLPKFFESFDKQFGENSKLIIFYDGSFQYLNEEIRTFTKKYKNIHVTRMSIEQGIEENHKNHSFQFNGRYLEEELSFPKNEFDILYIGEQDPTLTNLVMAWNSVKVYTYSPKIEQFRSEILPVNRLLQQRYFMIEKVKQSNIIGILVGTLAGVRYLEMLEYMKKVITEAGKKYYIIVVGKINLPKLANFSDIEIFVLLAGVESSLIDPREFYRPVVTPFELEIALVRGKEWTTDYKIDFNDVLKYSDVKEYNEDDETEDPYYQTISGTIVANPKAKAKTEEGTLAITAAQSSQIQAYSVQKLFLERSFKGLEMKIGETPVSLAVEGKTGIPNKGYVIANSDDQNTPNKL